jgi:hypothetical protein
MAYFYADPVSWSSAMYAQIIADFEALCTGQYAIVEFNSIVAAQARQLLERHALRASDAIQLASALLINEALVAASLTALTFLAADDRLLAAALTEGLTTDNPNTHS